MKTLLTFILALFSVTAFAQTISYRNLNANQFSSNNFTASLKSGVRLTNPVVIGTLVGDVTTFTNAAMLYVDTNGDDVTGVRGKENKPFKTLAAANTAATAGDTIYVHAGSNYVAAAVALKAVTLKGDGAASKLYGTTIASLNPMLIVTNSNTQINNLWIESNASGVGLASNTAITATNIVLRDLYVKGGANAANAVGWAGADGAANASHNVVVQAWNCECYTGANNAIGVIVSLGASGYARLLNCKVTGVIDAFLASIGGVAEIFGGDYLALEIDGITAAGSDVYVYGGKARGGPSANGDLYNDGGTLTECGTDYRPFEDEIILHCPKPYVGDFTGDGSGLTNVSGGGGFTGNPNQFSTSGGTTNIISGVALTNPVLHGTSPRFGTEALPSFDASSELGWLQLQADGKFQLSFDGLSLTNLGTNSLSAAAHTFYAGGGSGTPGGSDGNLQYNNGGTFGGESALFWDYTNDLLGIGKTPVAKLDVKSLDATYVLGLAGTTKGLRVETDATSTILRGVDSTLGGSYQPLTLGGSALIFETSGTVEAARILNTGAFGIGTPTPGAKLHVNGGVIASGANHAFGVAATVPYIGIRMNNQIVSDGSYVISLGVDIDPSLTLHANDTNYAAKLGVYGGTITTPTNTTVDVVASIHTGDPIIIKGPGGTINTAASMFIRSAPTEGTVNAALYVKDGDTLLGVDSGNVGIGTTTPVGKLDVNGQAGVASLLVTNTAVIGGNVTINGNTALSSLFMSTAGSTFSITSGVNQRAGVTNLTGGTVTVGNTTVTANTLVFPSRKAAGGTIGMAITWSVSAGTSFTINSDNALDTSTFAYFLIENP